MWALASITLFALTRYVLEGSVQRSRKRLRMNVQLIDAHSGQHLWAERFEKPVADLFDMQDEIVSRLANTLDAQLIEAEARRAECSLHPDAMDLYFQGRAWLIKGFTPECLTQARSFFERSLVFDPGNVEAMLGLANVDAVVGASFMTDEGPAWLAAAEATLIKVLSIRPNRAWAHAALGYAQIFTNRAAQGIRECEHALALDRNLADAHAALGLAKFYMGRAAETEGHILEAFRLSPRDVDARREPLQERDLRSTQVSPSAAHSPLNKATIRFTLLGATASVGACASLACRRGEGPLRGHSRRFAAEPVTSGLPQSTVKLRRTWCEQMFSGLAP
jgi:tetratricopeptide (TPR) repeat protein